VREASSDSHIPKITTVPPNYTDEEGRLFSLLESDSLPERA